MMMNWKDNINFILVEPRESGNIGASARAMKNMGFKKLCLVNPPDLLTDKAKWFAHTSYDIVESAQRYNKLSDAINDKHLVVGTTRRRGRSRGIIIDIDKGIERIINISKSSKVAILFGREDKGLLNKETEECNFLITIPTSQDQPSLNLSQAVLIVAYELNRRGEFKRSTDYRSKEIQQIKHGELNLLLERIGHVLQLIDYFPRGNMDLKKKIMQNLKFLINRAGLTEWEAKMIHGLCSQVEKKLRADV